MHFMLNLFFDFSVYKMETRNTTCARTHLLKSFLNWYSFKDERRNLCLNINNIFSAQRTCVQMYAVCVFVHVVCDPIHWMLTAILVPGGKHC